MIHINAQGSTSRDDASGWRIDSLSTDNDRDLFGDECRRMEPVAGRKLQLHGAFGRKKLGNGRLRHFGRQQPLEADGRRPLHRTDRHDLDLRLHAQLHDSDRRTRIQPIQSDLLPVRAHGLPVGPAKPGRGLPRNARRPTHVPQPAAVAVVPLFDRTDPQSVLQLQRLGPAALGRAAPCRAGHAQPTEPHRRNPRSQTELHPLGLARLLPYRHEELALGGIQPVGRPDRARHRHPPAFFRRGYPARAIRRLRRAERLDADDARST